MMGVSAVECLVVNSQLEKNNNNNNNNKRKRSYLLVDVKASNQMKSRAVHLPK